MLFKSRKWLFGGVLCVAASANAQTYTHSTLTAFGELGVAPSSAGSWDDAAIQTNTDTGLVGTTLSAATNFTGTVPLTVFSVTGSTHSGVITHLDPGSYSASFETSASITNLSAGDPNHGPAARAQVSHSIDIITGPAGVWTLNAMGNVVNVDTVSSAFSFQGTLTDHTAGWTHSFTLAAADTAFRQPYSETDDIAAGDWITLGWYEVSYGYSTGPSYLDPNVGASANGSVSLSGPSSVPEPSSMSVVGLAVLLLARRRRR